MAQILPDRDVKRALGSLIRGGDAKFLNPNGIELRLGRSVRFMSTGEEKSLSDGLFLQVRPGETVTISSLEEIDFSKEAVQKVFPNAFVMGLITPTTTMMREGISEVTTKIDSGFRGTLNWSLRNGSSKDLIIHYGEPIYKLTLFLLEGREAPEAEYGKRDRDRYQNSKGIARSMRRIPADIPKGHLIGSSIEKLDPKKHLREAGYPFNHIGTELTELHGKWEVVSSDVKLLKNEFEKLDNKLSGKIEQETSSLLEKINQVSDSLLQKLQALIKDRELRGLGAIVAIGSFTAAGYKALLASRPNQIQVYVFLGIAVLALLFTLLFGRSSKR